MDRPALCEKQSEVLQLCCDAVFHGGEREEKQKRKEPSIASRQVHAAATTSEHNFARIYLHASLSISPRRSRIPSTRAEYELDRWLAAAH
jgi:hypothetical protein